MNKSQKSMRKMLIILKEKKLWFYKNEIVTSQDLMQK